MRNQKGITLIALVITIIVLLILAGVTIAMLSGENGILNRATSTQAYNELAEAKENILLKADENIARYYDEAYAQQKATSAYTFPTLQAASQAAVNGSDELATYKANLPSHVSVVSATQIKYTNGRQTATVDLGIDAKGKITFQPVVYNGGYTE